MAAALPPVLVFQQNLGANPRPLAHASLSRTSPYLKAVKTLAFLGRISTHQKGEVVGRSSWACARELLHVSPQRLYMAFPF